jgi:hypothetical protein
MQTADKVTLEVFSLPPDRDLATAAVAAAVVQGAGAGQQDSRLELPAAKSIQQQEAELEGLVRGPRRTWGTLCQAGMVHLPDCQPCMGHMFVTQQHTTRRT